MKPSHFRRPSISINAGSMADIAFLLLIFFLVTATINFDQGILVKLPPHDPHPPSSDVLSRNILRVALNSNDELLVEGEKTYTRELKEKVKTFITNPLNDPHLSTKPQSAVISLMHDRGTSYEFYLITYNELKAAYNELWGELAQNQYGKSYTALAKSSKRIIRNQIPLIISEAEPSSFGKAGCEVIFSYKQNQ